MKHCLPAALALTLIGCTTAHHTTPPASSTAQRRALVVGMTAVDPASWGGWSGACPGSDVDASTMALLCREQGIPATTLANAQATREAVLSAARSLWAGLTAGDLLVIYYSGHGGQVRDTNGDEEDGQDETICLWDGPLTDDTLAALWSEMPAGLRVFFVTDSCHSGTNYRQRRTLRRSIPRDCPVSILHFGGAADGASSHGDAQGGTFTTALIDAWRAGQTYRAWYDTAASRMPKWQTPVLSEWGQSYAPAQALQ